MARGRPRKAGSVQGHRTKAELARREQSAPRLHVEPAEGARVVPLAPRGLLKATRSVWLAYWSAPVSRAVDVRSDGFGVERWIRDVDEYNRIRRVLVRTRLVKGSTGQPVLNPLASYIAEIARRIARAELEFGMTPASRAKLGLTIGEERLTAAKLNQMLSRGDWRSGGQADEVDADAIDGEWEEA